MKSYLLYFALAAVTVTCMINGSPCRRDNWTVVTLPGKSIYVTMHRPGRGISITQPMHPLIQPAACITGKTYNTPGIVPLSLAPPPNDNFASSINLPGVGGTVSENNADATLEPGEPFHSIYDFSSNTAWWSWTASYSGVLQLDTSASAFSTITAVYTGHSIDTLTRIVVSGGPNVYFNALFGVTYHIAIMSPRGIPGGQIVLKYYPTTISPWFLVGTVTNTSFSAVPDINGSLLYAQETVYTEYMRRTNHLGAPVYVMPFDKRSVHGITIHDKSSRVILNNVQLFPPGTRYYVEDFNGKHILTYNQDTAELALFKVKKNEAVLINTQVIPDILFAFFRQPGIYAYMVEPDYTGYDIRMGVRFFNKKMSKEIWQLPIEYGGLRSIFRNGISVRDTISTYHNVITFYKKGEQVLERRLDYKMSESPFYVPDRKMNLLYWYVSGPWDFSTNSPLTYINSKGDTVFQDVPLPGSGIVWDYGGFDGKDLYTAEPFGLSHRVTRFRIRSGIDRSGETIVNNYKYLDLYDKKPTVTQQMMGSSGLTQYNNKLSKQTWTEAPGPGEIYYFGKGVFVRYVITPMGNTTNYTYRIFNKKGIIAEHNITH